jgi:hypothetical protein
MHMEVFTQVACIPLAGQAEQFLLKLHFFKHMGSSTVSGSYLNFIKYVVHFIISEIILSVCFNCFRRHISLFSFVT